MIQQKLNFIPQPKQTSLDHHLKEGPSHDKVTDLGLEKIKKRSIESPENNRGEKKRKITTATKTDSSNKNQSLLTAWVKEGKTQPVIATPPVGKNKGWEKLHPELERLYSQNDQKKEKKIRTPKPPKLKLRDSLKDKCKVKHITDSVKHFEILQKILTISENHILITSHTVTWLPDDIYDLFIDAAERGVKISVVSNSEINPKIEEFFENNGIRYEQNSIHGKYLIADKTQFLVGSHNWLDFRNIDNESITENFDRSIKISKNEKYVHQLRGKVWSEIISHREEPSEKKKDFKKLSISGDSSHLTLLTTLFDHEDFLLTACSKAKRKIEIYSPFVTYNNATKRLNDIAKSLLNKTVTIHLFVGEGEDRLKGFIKSHPILKGNTHIRLDDFHRKSLMIDDEIISEGSFNWLSSSKSLESEFHNQDASLVIRGPIAREMIEKNSG